MSSGTVGFRGRPVIGVPRGVRFEYTAANQITAKPIAFDGKAYVPIWDGENDRDRVWFDADITATLSSTGANGRHPDYTSEQASTGYDVYFIWGPNAGFALLYVEYGDTIVAGTAGANQVSIDDVTGGTYTHWSAQAWFVRNDSSSNLLITRQHAAGQGEHQTDETSLLVVNGGTSTTAAAVSLAGGVIPTNAIAVRICGYVQNTTATLRDCNLYWDSGATQFITRLGLGVSSNDNAGYQAFDKWLALGNAPHATAFYYLWSGSVTGAGLVLFVGGWKLRGY